MGENSITMTLRLSQELQKKLDEIAERKYRANSKSHTVRLIIEDAWREMKEATNVSK
jgi:predicted transcriptional regulator